MGKSFTYKGYLFLGLLIFIMVVVRYLTKFESFESMLMDTGPLWKTFVIHLDKQVDKWDEFMKQYEKSSLHSLSYEPFSAIVGKEVNPADYLTKEALEELDDMDTNRRKLYHYQLTLGGIGCFLSHLALYRQLMEDDSTNVYLVLEDDIRFTPESLEKIQDALQEVYMEDPEWDFLLLGWHRRTGNLLTTPSQLKRPTGFWGTFGYLVTRSGATKMVSDFEENRMDGQIDAVMSKMQQQNIIKLYTVENPIIVPNYEKNTSVGSTVQTYQVPKRTDYDAFMFRGYSV